MSGDDGAVARKEAERTPDEVRDDPVAVRARLGEG